MPDASEIFGKQKSQTELGVSERKIYQYFSDHPTIIFSPSDYDEAGTATGVRGTVYWLSWMAKKGVLGKIRYGKKVYYQTKENIAALKKKYQLK